MLQLNVKYQNFKHQFFENVEKFPDDMKYSAEYEWLVYVREVVKLFKKIINKICSYDIYV